MISIFFFSRSLNLDGQIMTIKFLIQQQFKKYIYIFLKSLSSILKRERISVYIFS